MGVLFAFDAKDEATNGVRACVFFFFFFFFLSRRRCSLARQETAAQETVHPSTIFDGIGQLEAGLEEQLARQVLEIYKFPFARCADSKLDMGSFAGAMSLTYVQAASLLERSPNPLRRAVGLVALARAQRNVPLSDGRTLSERELYLEALTLDPNMAIAFNNLGGDLSRTERIKLPDGRMLGRQELYMEALRCSNTHAAAYCNLASSLAEGEAIVLPSGQRMNEMELYLEAIRMSQDGPEGIASTMNSLGVAMRSTDRVSMPDGREMTKQMVLLEGLRHDERNFRLYFNLALGLTADASVTLPDGRTLTKRELYMETLVHNPDDSFAYNNLGTLLKVGDSVILRDGRTLTKVDCFREALRCAPDNAQAYVNLSKVISLATVELPDGRVMNKKQLLMEAIRLKPSHANTYATLATFLEQNEMVTLPNGWPVYARQLYIHALELEKTFSIAYYNLALQLLRDTGSVCLTQDGPPLKRLDLFLLALQHDPSDPDYWNAAGGAMGKQQRVELPTLSDASFSRKRMFIQAIKCNPNLATSYVNLAMEMDRRDTITLTDGREVTRKEVYAHVYMLDPRNRTAISALIECMADDETLRLPDGNTVTRAALRAL
jgi:tetratricopeptide (TPR) repeat protein